MTESSSPAETTLRVSVELPSYGIVEATSSLRSIVGTTRVFTSGTQSDSLQRTDVTPSTPAEPSLFPATVTSSQPSPTSTTGTMICIFQSCCRRVRFTAPPPDHQVLNVLKVSKHLGLAMADIKYLVQCIPNNNSNKSCKIHRLLFRFTY